jgi:GST-like protein
MAVPGCADPRRLVRTDGEETTMITLYTYPTPNGHKASIMLEEVGLEYRVLKVDLAGGEQLRPDYLAISPIGKIPALIDEEIGSPPLRVFGSGAILLYLAEKTGCLLPEGIGPRTETCNWLAFAVRAPEKLPYAIDLFRNELRRCYRAVEERLAEQEYLVETGYSIADIAVFPFVAVSVQVAPEFLDTHPNIKRWYDTVAVRPAVERGMKVPE